MIITPDQLSAIHYYYFAMGTFGFCSMFFIGLDNLFSLIFLGFYVVNSAVAWYVAYVSMRKMKDYIVPQTRDFFLRHVVVTILCVGLAAGVWSSGAFTDYFLLNSIIMSNYFVLFLAGLWYAFTRMDFFGELFSFYDNYLFRKSKEFIIKAKNAHRGFFGREIVSDNDIAQYKYGTDGEVDENLISAWKNKSKTQYVLECLARIELSIARKYLALLRDKVSVARTMGSGVKGKKIKQRAELELSQKERDIMAFEKAFYAKTGESEFISL